MLQDRPLCALWITVDLRQHGVSLLLHNAAPACVCGSNTVCCPGHMPASSDLVRAVQGVGDALTRIVKDEGVGGLFRGAGPTVARAMALNMGMLASNDQVRPRLYACCHHIPTLCTKQQLSGQPEHPASATSRFWQPQHCTPASCGQSQATSRY